MPDLLTVPEVADMARTSPSTVRYWRHQGLGPAGFRLGRKIVFRREDVERWLAERQAADRMAVR